MKRVLVLPKSMLAANMVSLILKPIKGISISTVQSPTELGAVDADVLIVDERAIGDHANLIRGYDAEKIIITKGAVTIDGCAVLKRPFFPNELKDMVVKLIG